MKKKMIYEEPEIKVIAFDGVDVITSSGNNIGEDPGDKDGEWM